MVARADWRRRGIGSRLLRTIVDEALNDGRSVLTWSTFEAVPAGAAFSARAGAHAARVNRTSQLEMADVDWIMVRQWTRAERARALGYSLEIVDGPFPERLRADAATFHHIMRTAPTEELDVAEVIVDADFVAELDRSLEHAGRRRWTVLIRDLTGVCVGGTEVTFEPDDLEMVHQQNTGIAPPHRGIGLAKWAKGAMLERLRTERLEVRRVHTSNAFSNASMLSINDALGFRLISARTEWQVDVATVLRSLG